MNDPARNDERLHELSRRIERQRAQHVAREAKGRGRHAERAHHLVLRLLTDLGVALMAGVLLGYGVDSYFDSRPWGMLGGALLGLAAGVRNVLYTADSVTRARRKDTNTPS